MPRKFTSLRESDLIRQLALRDQAAIDPARSGAVDAKALIIDHERHQKQNTIAAIMVRLRKSFNEKHAQVMRSRAEHEHDRPDGEHPSIHQWRLFLASEDFAAFVCHCLRIDVVDSTPSLEVARWLRRLRLKNEAQRISLGTLFRECIGAAIDEWEQDHRHGGREPSKEDTAFVSELIKMSEVMRDTPETGNKLAIG